MRLHDCPACGARAFFRNTVCGSCGTELVYDPQADAFGRGLAPCANRGAIACNWADAGQGLCAACAMTEVVPDAFHADNRALWAEAETAKRWALAGLRRWGWFDDRDPGRRPVFHLLSERTATGRSAVMTGHAEGLVTINVVEGDPAELVRRREAMREPYRTLVGHFRHEIAHFLFERLAAERPGFLDGFRPLFGDERADYAAALAAYHDSGPPSGWGADRVSAYAAAHPHEDWAETAAHALALADLADSAAATGLAPPDAPQAAADPYAETDSERLFAHAAALGLALNHANRSMGLDDLYPFVLTAPVREKLSFAHAALRRAA